MVRAKAPSEAWKILKSMVEDNSSDRAKEQAKKNFEGLSMDSAESMKEYIARAKSLALNVQYHGVEVSDQEISRRVLNGLPPPLAPKTEVAGGAGDVEATIVADAASATVKVARRINGSRNISSNSRNISSNSRNSSSISRGISSNNRDISRGIRESSSPRISRNISSGTSNISNRSRSSSTRGTSRSSAAAVRTAFSGTGSITRLFQVW